MIHLFKKPATPCVALALAMSLAACAETPPEPQNDDLAANDANNSSIIRPDAEIDMADAPLEPLQMTIPFDGIDGETLPGPTASAIDRLLESEQVREGGDITLRSHTASDGSDEEAMERSQANAERVRDRLIAANIPEERIEIIAFGEQNPVQPNAMPDGTPNEEGRAANRRIEVNVTVPEEADPAPAGTPTATASPTAQPN